MGYYKYCPKCGEINFIDSTCNFDREQNFTKILHEKTTADRLI